MFFYNFGTMQARCHVAAISQQKARLSANQPEISNIYIPNFFISRIARFVRRSCHFTVKL